MVVFEDVNDVIEWLEPMDYCAFWEAVAPYHLRLQPRDHCDAQIAAGVVDQALVLEVLKSDARIALSAKFGLKRRRYEKPIYLTTH